jgi:general secretion pathway protein G
MRALDQILATKRGLKRGAGFTLLELMVVIVIIMTLAGIAIGQYGRSVQRAREASLKQDLFVMRNAIQQYTLDKQVAPSSLQDLVDSKYMSSTPTDPITRAKDWHLDFEDLVLTPQQSAPGLTDVHSSSSDVSPYENTPYNTW